MDHTAPIQQQPHSSPDNDHHHHQKLLGTPMQPQPSSHDLAIKNERPPPSIRKKQSQRFTVAHNNNHSTPSEPLPLIPASLINKNQEFTPSSASSNSDSDHPTPASHHPSQSRYATNPHSSSTTNSFDAASIFSPFSDSSTSISRSATNLSPAGSIAHNPIGNMTSINLSTVSASQPTGTPDAEDEIIPTAIVIKNIPFSVRREQLLTIIEDLMIPLPYAFNYHFDNGVFRGLAFANFRSSAEADAAVAGLNGFDISGRKLRVEYKKVLQAGEKERIEKEKAIKRMRSMQLQKESSLIDQFASQPPLPPMSSSSTHITFGNYSQAEDDYRGLGAHNHILPSSIPHRPSQSVLNSFHSSNFLHQQFMASNHELGSAQQAFEGLSISGSHESKSTTKDLDMNDPQTLELYSRIVVFKEDNLRDELAFAKSLSGPQRRTVHQIAKKLGLEHRSEGVGDDRFVVVSKTTNQALPRINRVASSANMSRVASSQQTHYLGQQSNSQQRLESHNLTTANLLRMKKSMPDMRMREINNSGVFYPDTTSMKDLLGGRKSIMNLRELNGVISKSSKSNLTPFPFGNHHLGGEESFLSNHNNNLLIGNPNSSNSSSISSNGGGINNNNNNNNNHHHHQIIRQPKGPEGGSGKGFGIPTSSQSSRGLQKLSSRTSLNHLSSNLDDSSHSHHHHHHQHQHQQQEQHHLVMNSSVEGLEFGSGTHQT